MGGNGSFASGINKPYNKYEEVRSVHFNARTTKVKNVKITIFIALTLLPIPTTYLYN